MEKRNVKRQTRAFVLIICMIMFASVFALPEQVSAITYKPYRVSITSAESDGHASIKLKWKAAKHADKYQVYRATSKNGTYKRIGSTTKTSFTNINLTTGKRYYYKVRAVNDYKYGRFSKIKSAVPKLRTPYVKSVIEKGEKYIKFRINKVSGANGYIVYRSTSKNGSYKKVGTSKDTVFKNSSLKANTGYYFKVKAYKYVNGKTKYSNMSSAKYVKTKAHKHNWKVKYNNNTETKYVCSGCGNVKFHKHDWNEKLDVNKELTGYECSCGKTKTHNHKYILTETATDETGTIDGFYECNCGATRDYQHEHEYKAVYGEVDKGSLKTYTEDKPVKYCQVCENLVESDPDEHTKNTHGGGSCWVSDSTEYQYKYWKSNFTEEVIGYTCRICGAEKSHIHTWKAVYADGYYAKVKVEDLWNRCNGCGADVSHNEDLIEEHILEHYRNGEGLPGWTSHYRTVYKEFWKEGKIKTGYICSCGAIK